MRRSKIYLKDGRIFDGVIMAWLLRDTVAKYIKVSDDIVIRWTDNGISMVAHIPFDMIDKEEVISYEPEKDGKYDV
jgi:hypothetical protein